MQRASIKKQKLSVHEGVKFICDQCEYEATRRSHITEHKKAQPDGVTFDGDQCVPDKQNVGIPHTNLDKVPNSKEV